MVCYWCGYFDRSSTPTSLAVRLRDGESNTAVVTAVVLSRETRDECSIEGQPTLGPPPPADVESVGSRGID